MIVGMTAHPSLKSTPSPVVSTECCRSAENDLDGADDLTIQILPPANVPLPTTVNQDALVDFLAALVKRVLSSETGTDIL